MAVTVRGEQLGLLARMRRARLRHRRGSKAGRYYRARRRSPKLLNFEELQQPTTCSSSKHFSVAERCAVSWPVRPSEGGRTTIASEPSSAKTVTLSEAIVSK